MDRNISYDEFVLKLIELDAEFKKAVYQCNYSDIEYYSKKIGRLITRFLDQNKMRVEK